MPPKSKKAKEERLAKQRLCQRRRYAEIKNDPQLLALDKEKRRQKYLKKKVEKNTEKSPRSIKEQRKKWKENSKRYRQRKKEGRKSIFEAVQIKTVDNIQDASNFSETNFINQEDPLQVNSAVVQAAVKKTKYEEFKKRKMLLRLVATYKKKDKIQTKKIQRLQKLLKEARQMNKMEYFGSVTDASASGVVSNNSNEIEISSYKSNKRSVIETIKNFYLQDANSVLCAGKKQYVTKNKVQMQKRCLCLPLKDLHQIFLIETKIRVSYSFFCKLRPFWVTFPKKSNRETCECQIHENMKLLIEALHKASIIREKTHDQVLSKLCCDLRNIACLKRYCDACKSNCLEYYLDANNSVCTFYEWKRETKEVILTNGRKKKQTITKNNKITLSTSDVIIKFENDLENFCDHTVKIVSQYNAIKNLKENLNIHEACIHIDFSENYSLKYGSEVQSFHFGASRQQLCLHTAVIYTHSFNTGQITPKSMCTISDCLRHDAAAVWAHLIPLIEESINLNPFIDTIHFLSDSPSSQYRNKYIFFLITQLCKDFSQLKRITWNYSEAGHGKGAPDGVGATLKRTADRMVAFGKDVGTYEQFHTLITKYTDNDNLNVIVKKVDKEEILFRDSLFPKQLKPFRGTFSVYQVLWEKSASRTTVRKMSCFDCDVSEICVHGKHLGFIDDIIDLQKENAPSTSFEPAVTTLDILKHKRVNETRTATRSEVLTIHENNLILPSNYEKPNFG